MAGVYILLFYLLILLGIFLILISVIFDSLPVAFLGLFCYIIASGISLPNEADINHSELRITNSIEFVREITEEDEISLFRQTRNIILLKAKNNLYEVGLTDTDEIKYVLLGSKFLYHIDDTESFD